MTQRNADSESRTKMFQPREPASGDFPVLENGKQAYHVDGARFVPDEDDPSELVPVTKSTPGAKPLTEPWVINPADLFAEDHRLVQSHPHLFREVQPDRPTVASR